MKSKFFLTILAVSFIFFSCQKEDEIQSTEELNSVNLGSVPDDFGPADTDCSDIRYNPLMWVEYGIGNADRRDENCNPISPAMTKVNAYVTSNTIVDYERVVQVYYTYKHKSPACPFDKGKDNDGIIQVHQFRIPANSHKSATREILGWEVQFEADGEVTSKVANVSSNGQVSSCFVSPSIKINYVSQYEKLNKPPGFGPPN